MRYNRLPRVETLDFALARELCDILLYRGTVAFSYHDERRDADFG